MERRRPLVLVLTGAGCCAFAAFWLFWLLMSFSGDFLDVLAVALGNRELRDSLAGRNLAHSGPIRMTFLLFALQTALLATLIWTGYALISFRRSARWSALAFSGFALVITLLGTIIRVFFLTLPGEVIRMSPILMDAAIILFSIILGGTMLLPNVVDAFAGIWEPSSIHHLSETAQ